MCIILIFWRFKDKSFTVVSSIIKKEDSYSEPAIRRVEMPCSPEHTKPLETRLFYRTTPIFCFYALIICNHTPLLCTGHLQNCYHDFIFWVLKRTVSLRWYYICFSWKHLKHIYRFLFCVFKDISFTVAPLDFWNSCKRLQNRKGAQWLSGRVLDSRPKGRGFEPHRRHCVVSLSKNIYPSLVLVQPLRYVLQQEHLS